jgi:hypothetical protein
VFHRSTCSTENASGDKRRKEVIVFLAKFSVTEQGLFYGNDEKQEWIAQSFTARPARQSEDPHSDWGRLLSFVTADGKRREVFVSSWDFFQHPYKSAARLIDQGMRINSSRRAHLKLVEFLYRGPEEVA